MNLTGKMLIAMPGMEDPRFEHSVVAVCAHTPEGAMGLIVNKPIPEPGFEDLLNQLGIPVPASDRGEQAPILFGGPVETGRGFVLHSRDWRSKAGMMEISDDLAMTATRDVLEHIAAGSGPERALFALGYAGWGPGQLEDEILANGWLVSDGNAALALDTDHVTKWGRALAMIGVDPRTLSSAAGHA